MGDPAHGAALARHAGFLAEAGAPVRPDRPVQGDIPFRSAVSAAKILRGGADRPRAVSASNDDMAPGAAADEDGRPIGRRLDVRVEVRGSGATPRTT